MALSFHLETPSSSSQTCQARSGTIRHRQRPSPIKTPCLWPSSHRGILPSFTPDQLEGTSDEPSWISGVHITLEQLLDHAPPLYKRNPAKDASLAGYYGYPPVQRDGPLLLMGVKDPARLVVNNAAEQKLPNVAFPKGTSGEQHVGIQTVKGHAKLTVTEYLQHCLPGPHNPSKPDLLICMTDEPDDAFPSNKRLHKSIRRSLHWAHQITQALQTRDNNDAPPLLVPLPGSSNPGARRAFSHDLVDPDTLADFTPPNAAPQPQPDASIDDRVWGYVLRWPHLSHSLPSQAICELFNTSLQALPPAKFRLALNPSGPHAILHLIRHVGVDAFVEDFNFRLADAGVALDFEFGQAANPVTSANFSQMQDVGINLFDPVYEHDFTPLSSSPLAEVSRKEQPLTRAYLHHLLNVHELSAHILLNLHNSRATAAFFTRIRELLVTGADSFVQAYDTFFARYPEPPAGQPLTCLQAALAARARVNQERGKGRKKGATVEDVPLEEQVIDS